MNNEVGVYDPDPISIADKYQKVKELDKQQLRTLDMKHKFLVSYEKSMGNVSLACDMAGIKSRKTFYNWCDTDPEFKKAVDESGEVQKDFLQDLIFMKILRDHGPTIRWFLERIDMKYRLKRDTMPPPKQIDPWKKWEMMDWDHEEGTE